MRRVVIAFPLALLALAGCASSVDSWAEKQGERLTEAGVTYPPEQEHNTIISMVSACAFKQGRDNESSRRIYMSTTPMQADWISEVDAGKMYDLADEEFCNNLPDEPLGENR
jgi:uncharacterized protein YceK